MEAVVVTICHRLTANVDEPDDRNQRPQEPEPTDVKDMVARRLAQETAVMTAEERSRRQPARTEYPRSKRIENRQVGSARKSARKYFA